MSIEFGATSSAERNVQYPQYPQDPEDPQDPQYPQEPQEPQDLQGPRDSRDSQDDELDVGRPPRAPWSSRRQRVVGGLTTVAALAALAVGTGALSTGAPRKAEASKAEASKAEASKAEASKAEASNAEASKAQASNAQASKAQANAQAGAPAGPALTPDGAGLLVPTGGTEALGAAPAAVAAITDRLPTLAGVQGGSPVPDTGRYGLYVSAQAGDDISVIVYAARSPGTTLQVDSYVSRSRFDRTYTNHLDVTAFTGTGWWVRILLTGPGDWQPPTSDMTALAVDPRLLPT